MTLLAPSLPADVRIELLNRGDGPDPRPGESFEEHRDRLDTVLMAWFRDTRRREAFDSLYEHAHERVFTWLRWVLREQQVQLDPVELLQDTFVNVYRYAGGFRSDHPASFRAWVRTIAANVVRRSRANLARRWFTGSMELAPELEDRGSTPPTFAGDSEERRSLRGAWVLFLHHYLAAYAALSPRDRQALQWVEVDGLSYAETGRRLRVGPSNMKMIMLRARRRLQLRMSASMRLAGVEKPSEAAPRTERRTA
jgi:RNA polymerase sigma factor (sigma-70 family)